MNTRPTPWRYLPPLVLVLAVLLATACQPPPPRSAPVPDRVALTSDSIGLQAMYYGSAGTAATGWDVDQKIGLGWRAPDAQPRLTRDVASPATSPDVVVIEFGHNYSRGYTTEHRNGVTSLAFTAHPDACVVMVLPHAPAHLAATHRQAIADYRAHATALAAARPGTVLADWSPVARAHPDYLDTDGVHLRPEAAPARAFIDVMADGVARCA